jgi:uncharacterized protein
MTTPIKRSNRLRKKLYLDEYAILGFEFSCKIDLSEEADYGQFFDNFAGQVEDRNLFVSLDGNEELFEGFVTSGDRYGSATEEDRKAIEGALSAYKIVSDVTIGKLVDACYEM